MSLRRFAIFTKQPYVKGAQGFRRGRLYPGCFTLESCAGLGYEYPLVVISRSAKSAPILLALLMLLPGACSQDNGPAGADPEPSPEPPKVSEAAFELGEVRAFDAQERPESAQKAHDEAVNIVGLINSFYNAAFLNPEQWQSGAHPDLAGLFTAEAQGSMGANLPHLAMAELSDQVELVEPTLQRMDRTAFFVDDDGSLPLGLVSVTFEATGKVAGGEADVQIRHQAHYWLQREGETYKISAYNTLINAGEGT